MAGAGFKSFAAGEVLLSSEVNTFLMEQTVMVFDSAAARDGVITAPSEGMLCYLKDTNAVEKYTGSDWVAVVQDTSPITTEGDLIVGDASGDPVRLPVGAAGEVLTSDGDTVSFVAPAAPAGAGFTLLNAGGTSLTGSTTITVSGISNIETLVIFVTGASSAGASRFLRIRFNADTGNNYAFAGQNIDVTTLAAADINFTTGFINLAQFGNNAANTAAGCLILTACKSTSLKAFTSIFAGNGSSTNQSFVTQGLYQGTSAISEVTLFVTTDNFDAGTIFVYGSEN